MELKTLVLRTGRLILPVCVALLGARECQGASTLRVPRISHPPKIEDFEGMKPTGAAAELQHVTDFIQNQPSDGQPATDRTDAYLGYDQSNLYVVMVCWDKHNGVRADLTRREPSTPFDSDDYVEVTLDTFRDQRHALVFECRRKSKPGRDAR